MAETGQIYCGQSGGLNVTTNTAHPRRFSANRFAPGATNSIEILGTGTCDVEINAPLKSKVVLSTFDNAVAIGAALGATGNALGATGNATIGGTVVAGNATVSGVLKAHQLRVTGTEANDGVTIQNVEGTEVAKFHNDYRCRFNGNTSIWGDASISGSLSVAGFLAAKPYISFRVSTSGGTPSSATTVGTPGVVTLTN